MNVITVSASCAVTALVRNRIGQEFLLEKSLDVGSRARYRVSDIELTEAEYEAKLKELGLFADFHIIPQDMVTRFSSMNPSELGKLLESLFLEGYTLEFTAQEEKELKGFRARASNLRRRIAVLTKTVEQIRRLNIRLAQPVNDIEVNNRIMEFFRRTPSRNLRGIDMALYKVEEIITSRDRSNLFQEELQKCERRLTLAELWRLDEKMKEHVSKLHAIRSSDVEARRAAIESEIEAQQTEVRDLFRSVGRTLGSEVIDEKFNRAGSTGLFV